ncbi:putative glycosyltransferase, TIGR04372 family [Verrucomicrobium sp. GAS474]|nr:putative glycosyltransferase, TIGR04372 family [Verrucomicrobium sp. GAS474]
MRIPLPPLYIPVLKRMRRWIYESLYESQDEALVAMKSHAFLFFPRNYGHAKGIFLKLVEMGALKRAKGQLKKIEKNFKGLLGEVELAYLYEHLSVHYRGVRSLCAIEDLYRDRLKREPECMWARRELAGVHFRLGDVPGAIAVVTEQRLLRDHLAGRLGYDTERTRYFGSFYTLAIGHIALLGFYAQQQELQGPEGRRNRLAIDPKRVANACLLSYVEPFFDLVTEEETELQEVIAALEDPHLLLHGGGNRWDFFYDGLPQIGREWERRGNGPFLTLREEHTKDGEKRLREMGLPEGAWFVVLHVRETRLGEVRNAKVADYLPAIREITRRGGWVIRMGDRTMTPLPPMEQVLDYAHDTRKSDSLDIFLLGACRFFLGTNSGPSIAAKLFGKRIVFTNFAPLFCNAFGTPDTWIPILFRDTKDQRLLTLREMAHSPLVYAEYPAAIPGYSVEVVPNTPEEIFDAVVEMFGVLESEQETFSVGLSERIRFDALCRELGINLHAPPSSRFLARHAKWLD